MGDDFGLEGLRFHFGTGTHSSLWKDYAVTLVLVHSVISFGVLNVEQCCGAEAGHLVTEAVLLLQSKLFRVMCGVTKILQEL